MGEPAILRATGWKVRIKGHVTTVFRYKVSGSSVYPPTKWIDGSYITRGGLGLSSVTRRLREGWKNVPGVKVIAVEVLS